MKTKIIANYLPQYHSIPENDLWWGKGYTDWVAVRNSKPLFKGHKQPRIPIDNNYYDLSEIESIRCQVDLANKYGVYGFGIYHYWFSNNLRLLEKPAEIIKDNIDLNIHYMFIWDNSSWKRTWSNVEFANDWAPLYDNEYKEKKCGGYLAELRYGDENDWRNNFEYLVPYFKDNRYIKINDKPVFAFFCPDNNNEIVKKMCSYWNEIAPNYGIPGILCLGRKIDGLKCNIDGEILYEPHWSGWVTNDLSCRIRNKIKNIRHKLFNQPIIENYDRIWKKLISNAEKYSNDKIYYSAFVSYDDTPRRGNKGRVILGATPELFENNIRKLLSLSEKNKKEFLFLTAWNEWGEGAYLEPDTENKYAYLNALKRAIKTVEDVY